MHTSCSLLPQRLKNLTCFSGGQHCPRGLLDPPWLPQCEVSWLDATLAAYLLSKVTVRLIFPQVVLIVAVRLLIGRDERRGDKSWTRLIQVRSRNGIKMDIFEAFLNVHIETLEKRPTVVI